MTGHDSLCNNASSLDDSVVLLGRQQAPFLLSKGQAAGGEANSIKKQNVANPAVTHQSFKADSSSGFPLFKVQVDVGPSMGSAFAGKTSECRQGTVFSGVSDTERVTVKYAGLPDAEPGTTEHARGNVHLALSIVPHTHPVTVGCDGDSAASCTPWINPVPPVSRLPAFTTVSSRQDVEQCVSDTSTLNSPSGRPTTAASSSSSDVYRCVDDQCLSQPDDANRAPWNARLDNLVSHSTAITAVCLAQPSVANLASEDSCWDNIASLGRAAGGQSFLVPSPSTGMKLIDKKQFASLPLPNSLARSFHSSEMDKITRAIVRVNEFGSTLASNNAIKQGNYGMEVGSLRKSGPRVLPSVGAFTVQCAKCLKWRLVPSKEQYEQIRQYILEKPFFCSTASIWQPGASCDDPAELCEDKNFVWAIDKPNIPLTPSGWERLLVIRSEGCSKFADIYYVSPSGRKLRSMPDIERYLSEHPELVNAGVSLSQFSFEVPRALDKNYCRKKTVGSSTVMRGSITHKNTPAHSLGVRSQPLKVPYVRNFSAEHFNHRDSAAQPLECRHPATGLSHLNCPENGPLAIQPLRACDPDNHHALMLACHARVGLESLTNAREQHLQNF